VQLVAAVESAGILEADIGAGTAFDAVVAREFVAVEQRGGVEDEALRILVRQPAGELLVWAGIDLRDRFEDMWCCCRSSSGSDNVSPARP
jgi:hypothetical protein